MASDVWRRLLFLQGASREAVGVVLRGWGASGWELFVLLLQLGVVVFVGRMLRVARVRVATVT